MYNKTPLKMKILNKKTFNKIKLLSIIALMISTPMILAYFMTDIERIVGFNIASNGLNLYLFSIPLMLFIIVRILIFIFGTKQNN